jgi:hypothetical protein
LNLLSLVIAESTAASIFEASLKRRKRREERGKRERGEAWSRLIKVDIFNKSI